MNTIKLNPAKSSNIAATGYDPVTQTLAIQFKGDGPVYHYHDVPAKVHADMGKAESLGSFVHKHIVKIYKTTKKATQ